MAFVVQVDSNDSDITLELEEDGDDATIYAEGNDDSGTVATFEIEDGKKFLTLDKSLLKSLGITVRSV